MKKGVLGKIDEKAISIASQSFSESLDFVRCQRPDGTFYASATLNCRKGNPAPKEGEDSPKRRGNRGINEESPPTCSIKKGKRNCEYNWAELVVAAVIEDPNVPLDNIAEKSRGGNEGYLEDLSKRDPDRVRNYADNLRKQVPDLLKGEEVDTVWILGKKQSLNKEVEELQKGLDLKDKKSDVLVKTKSGNYIGVSVKDGPGATLTNYAVEKMVGAKQGSKLQSIKKDMIESAGLPIKMDKARRAEYNALFKGKNPYHEEMRDYIMKNKEEILKKWAESLYAETPFPIYSFDGENLRYNSRGAIEGKKFDLKPIKVDQDKAAKIFFEVSEDGKPSYIWDIRWKGNTTHSPQIQTHRIH